MQESPSNPLKTRIEA